MMNAYTANKLAASTVLSFLIVSITLLSLMTWEKKNKITVAIPEGVEGVALRLAAERFGHAHNILVEVQPFPYDELYAEEDKSLSRHEGTFDVIMLDDPWLPALVAGDLENRLRMLSPQNWQEYDLNDFVGSTLLVSRFPPCVETSSCTSDYYALPFVGNSQLFCSVNSDKAGPGTWDAVLKDSRSAPAGKPYYVNRIGPGNSVVTDFMPILWAFDPGSFLNTPDVLARYSNVLKQQQNAYRAFKKNPNGKNNEQLMQRANDAVAKAESELAGQANFNSDNASLAAAALQIFVQLVGNREKDSKKKILSRSIGEASLDDFDVTAYLARHEASKAIEWSAWAMMLSQIQARDQSQKCTQVPQGPGGGTPELGAWLLSIPANTTNYKEAEQFIRFVTSKDELLEAAKQGNPPPRESVFYNAEIVRKYGDLSTQLKLSLQHARPRPRTRYWRQIEKCLGKELDKLIDGIPICPTCTDSAEVNFVVRTNQELAKCQDLPVNGPVRSGKIDSSVSLK